MSTPDSPFDPSATLLEVGSPARYPPWAGDAQSARLGDFRGHPVVLAFFPDAWDPAREEYLALYNRLLARVPHVSARLLGLSVDGDWCRLIFADGEEHVPVLQGVGQAPGYAAGADASQALYLIDADGIVRWRQVCGAGQPPRTDDLVAALAALTPSSSADDSSRSVGGAPSRREFVAMALLATMVLAAPPFLRAENAAVPRVSPPDPTRGARAVTLRVNGHDLRLTIEPQVTLLDALREYAGLTGTKKGCDHGQCGACTVHVGGRRVLSCMTFAMMAQGREITTIEGLARNGALHPMQAAFVKHDGFQCGYCTPGQIMSATALLDEPCGRSDADVRECMSGNLCRCGAYPNIVAAIQDVRGARAG